MDLVIQRWSPVLELESGAVWGGEVPLEVPLEGPASAVAGLLPALAQASCTFQQPNMEKLQGCRTPTSLWPVPRLHLHSSTHFFFLVWNLNFSSCNMWLLPHFLIAPCWAGCSGWEVWLCDLQDFQELQGSSYISMELPFPWVKQAWLLQTSPRLMPLTTMAAAARPSLGSLNCFRTEDLSSEGMMES